MPGGSDGPRDGGGLAASPLRLWASGLFGPSGEWPGGGGGSAAGGGGSFSPNRPPKKPFFSGEGIAGRGVVGRGPGGGGGGCAAPHRGWM